ncbi:hypothetical protein N7532_000711 [Penicillium argentinense]|uniref:Sialidase domain-containing protein n=1 Tax=Penicillium argentinense TaxID=1131581 RepID=A0A9W9KP40_9EURO|nr:uncharacterized protein N7532_000711 [Penicillium argentinense]KAJ5112666.1 hypothetical protein N7532_000711 [Penicillium argentinense]
MFHVRGLAGYLFLSLGGLLSSPSQADSVGTPLWQAPVLNEVNAYARVIELQHAGDQNGKLVATWEHWYTTAPGSTTLEDFPAEIIIRESGDGGKSWSTLATINETSGVSYSAFWQPALFEFPHRLGNYPAGTLLLVGNLVPADISSTNFFAWRSQDHGETWDPVGIWQQGSIGKGIWEPFLFLDNEGRLVALFSDERDHENHSQMVVHVVSEDGGDTWGDVVRDIASPNKEDRAGMATVAKMDNGEYIMSYELCGFPNCPSRWKTSTDGVNWNANDLGTQVSTSDSLYAGASPYIVWDSPAKQLVMATREIWYNAAADEIAPEQRRAVFTNKNYGRGAWLWSPSPWRVSEDTANCSSANYSPNLLPIADGIIRYTAPTSMDSARPCSEATGEAPIGILPYEADFRTKGDAGWIDLEGSWSVLGDQYSFASVSDNDAIALTGSSGWSDYTIEANVKVSDSHSQAGLAARVSASTTAPGAWKGYSAVIDAGSGKVTLFQHDDSITVLHSEDHFLGILEDKWYYMTIAVDSQSITVTLCDESGLFNTHFTAEADTFPQGMAGLFGNNGSGSFRKVRIL